MPANVSFAAGDPCLRRKRHSFRWPKQARDLVRAYVAAQRSQGGAPDPVSARTLITKLVEASGNPRDACWRFARQGGLRRSGSTARGRNGPNRDCWISLRFNLCRKWRSFCVGLRSPYVRCCIGWGRAPPWEKTGLRNIPWPKRFTSVRRKWNAGSRLAG